MNDAKWYEKISTVTLIACVAAIGLAPFWLSSMIGTSMQPVIDKILAVNPF
jgi:NADH-quinone oxidoreductase subunit M